MAMFLSIGTQSSTLLFDTHDVKEGEISKLVEGRERLNQELTHLYLDNTKAKNDTNWKPSIEFDEGIKMYIKWAKTNMKNWDKDYKV